MIVMTATTIAAAIRRPAAARTAAAGGGGRPGILVPGLRAPSLLASLPPGGRSPAAAAAAASSSPTASSASSASRPPSWPPPPQPPSAALDGYGEPPPWGSAPAPPTPPFLPPALPSPESLRSLEAPSASPRKSFWGRVWDRYSVGGQQRRSRAAERLFQAASVQASDPRWYGPGRVGRDFRPRHALLTMHLWFLHKRLISDFEDRDNALLVQEELFHILWDDTTCRIRRTGASEMRVNKLLGQVQQYTFLHLTHYDHAYTPHFLERPRERMKELRNLVMLHVVRPNSMSQQQEGAPAPTSASAEAEAEAESAPDPDPASAPPPPPAPLVLPDQVDRLAWYVEANYQNVLLDWPDPYYREARVKWVDLPDFGGMRDPRTGDELPVLPLRPDDVLPFPWRESVTRRGAPYYWNPRTGESSWERPVFSAAAGAGAT